MLFYADSQQKMAKVKYVKNHAMISDKALKLLYVRLDWHLSNLQCYIRYSIPDATSEGSPSMMIIILSF